jgi:hypothetical protein
MQNNLKNLGMIKFLFDDKSITIDWKFQFNKNEFFIIGNFKLHYILHIQN